MKATSIVWSSTIFTPASSVAFPAFEVRRADDVGEELRRQAALPARPEQLLEGVFDVLGGERAAAVEFHAFAQLEAKAVAGRQAASRTPPSAGNARPSGVIDGEAFINLLEHLVGIQFRVGDRIHLRGIGLDVDPQGPGIGARTARSGTIGAVKRCNLAEGIRVAILISIDLH